MPSHGCHGGGYLRFAVETGGTSLGNVLEGVRVLVVEDEAVIALDLETTLRGFGCEVLGPAPTVPEALALLADGRSDVALLDLGLKDGWSGPVAEALGTSRVPFALVTGYPRGGLDSPALRDAPHLAKPFAAEGLREVVLGLLGGGPRSAGP